jgi:hypothetical protein
VLRAAGETETTQDWLQLDEGNPWISASDRRRNCCSDVILFIYFHQHHLHQYIFHLFVSKGFLSYMAIVCFINPDNLSSRPINPN